MLDVVRYFETVPDSDLSDSFRSVQRIFREP